MGQHSYEKAIFDSWRNCARLGLCPDIVYPVHSGMEEEIVQLQKACRLEIAALTSGVGAIGTEMPEHTAFLLANGHGILLKKNSRCSISLQIKGRKLVGGKLQRDQCGCSCFAFESII